MLRNISRASGTSPKAPDDQRLQQLLHGFKVSQAICVAVRLGLPDLIAEAPREVSELAVVTATFPSALTLWVPEILTRSFPEILTTCR